MCQKDTVSYQTFVLRGVRRSRHRDDQNCKDEIVVLLAEWSERH